PELVSFQMDNVHNTAKILFSSYRQGKWNNCSAECFLCALDRHAKVRMLFVEFRNRHHAWDDELIRVCPRLLCLNFNTLNTINYSDSTIGDPKSRTGMTYESSIAWGIYEIDFGFAMV